MLEFLKRIFIGHTHKWKIIKGVNVVENDDDKVPIWFKYYCQCESCGKIRTFSK